MSANIRSPLKLTMQGLVFACLFASPSWAANSATSAAINDLLLSGTKRQLFYDEVDVDNGWFSTKIFGESEDYEVDLVVVNGKMLLTWDSATIGGQFPQVETVSATLPILSSDEYFDAIEWTFSVLDGSTSKYAFELSYNDINISLFYDDVFMTGFQMPEPALINVRYHRKSDRLEMRINGNFQNINEQIPGYFGVPFKGSVNSRFEGPSQFSMRTGTHYWQLQPIWKKGGVSIGHVLIETTTD